MGQLRLSFLQSQWLGTLEQTSQLWLMFTCEILIHGMVFPRAESGVYVC